MARDHIAMTFVEQHRMVSELRELEARMIPADSRDFEKLANRDKDDEELDQLAKGRLMELHETYVIRPRPASNPLDALFSGLKEV
jgi:hypothetical protein